MTSPYSGLKSPKFSNNYGLIYVEESNKDTPKYNLSEEKKSMSEASESPDDTYSNGKKEDEETNNQKSL